jgi:predicted nucleic acid-binding protein
MQLQNKEGCVMSGDRLLLDTNAVTAVLVGNKLLLRRLHKADWIGMSIISHIELLSFKGWSDADHMILDQFMKRVKVLGLSADDNNLITTTVRLRQEYHLKLPDAIIAATAICQDAALVTEDDQLKSVHEAHAVGFRK